MCGILFIVDPNLNINKANQCLNLIKNRGPDGTYDMILNNTIYIGQTILSITGEIKEENFTFNNNYLAYNGEIYNYKVLKSLYPQQLSTCQTDTQVLLKLISKMGTANANKLIDGMYAYVFFNGQEKTITLSRDMQGEKNLYYYLDKSKLIVCSTILPILKYLDIQLDIQPDNQELRNYFYTRHLMSNSRTIYPLINQLKPGETIVLQSYNSFNKLKIKSRNIKNITSLIKSKTYMYLSTLTQNQILHQFEQVFKKSIYQMIPDVPYASIVSGGVDSSLITAYLVNSDKPPDLLVSVYCPGKDQISNNLFAFETSLGRKIDIIRITPERYALQIQECQKMFGSPVNTHSAVSLSILAKYVKHKGIKVLFTGEGADELFGGYECYRKLMNNYDISKRNHEKYIFCPSNYTKKVFLDISFKKNDSKQLDSELKHYWEQANNIYKKMYLNKEIKERKEKNQKIKNQKIKNQKIKNQKIKNQKIKNQKIKKNTFIQSLLLTDSLLEMPSVGFRSSDLMCQMYGVEPRTPFTCKEVMRWALNLPLRYKIDSTTTKKILKQLYLKFYPKHTLLPKQGFTGFPNESISLLTNQIKINKFKAYTFLDIKNIFTILTLMKKEPSNSKERALQWKLINTELFLLNNT